MTVHVKICGVTEPGGVAAAVGAGADAVGFVFAASPRRVSPARAAELADGIPVEIERVAVLRLPTAREIEEILREFRPDRLQFEFEMAALVPVDYRDRFVPVFHDGPDVERRVAEYLRSAPRSPRAIHLEGPGRGGRGVRVDLDRAARIARMHPTVLAGGLDAVRVPAAVWTVRPFGVDVSSGVESTRGVKDPKKIVEFVAAVRESEQTAPRVREKETR